MGLQNLLWEPTAAGNGGDEWRAETRLMRLIHECISSLDLRGTGCFFNPRPHTDTHKHTHTRTAVGLTRPGRAEPSSRLSADGRRGASWCSRPPARPESGAGSPPPRRSAGPSCSHPDAREHTGLSTPCEELIMTQRAIENLMGRVTDLL